MLELPKVVSVEDLAATGLAMLSAGVMYTGGPWKVPFHSSGTPEERSGQSGTSGRCNFEQLGLREAWKDANQCVACQARACLFVCERRMGSETRTVTRPIVTHGSQICNSGHAQAQAHDVFDADGNSGRTPGATTFDRAKTHLSKVASCLSAMEELRMETCLLPDCLEQAHIQVSKDVVKLRVVNPVNCLRFG